MAIMMNIEKEVPPAEATGGESGTGAAVDAGFLSAEDGGRVKTKVAREGENGGVTHGGLVSTTSGLVGLGAGGLR